jgi:hypothetical protein
VQLDDFGATSALAVRGIGLCRRVSQELESRQEWH